jgi:HEAT repeat protein
MARELILKLSDDVGQLLVAGAHLAPSSPDLAQDRDGLARLAAQVDAKAPAGMNKTASLFMKLAEAADRTTRAGATVASELMNLMQMAAQVRAAQAQPAPATAEAKPLVPCPPLGTPCNAKDLDDLYRALVEKGQGRMEVIDRHIESETIIDLRLVEALVFAMGDSWIGEKVTESAIPKLGRAIVAPIRARLDLKKGRTVDGRRLRALVAIEKEAALPLLEQAVAEGTADIREAAMDAIADYMPGRPEFEKHALESIRKEKSSGVRRAAVRALAGSSSDESLELLLEALDKSSTTRAAADALESSKHRDAPRRMLAKLQVLVAGASTKPKPKASDKEKEKAKNEAAQHRGAAHALLCAMAQHRLPEIAGAALELLGEYGASAALAVLGSGDEAQLRRIADTLSGDEEELYSQAATASLRLPDAFKRLSPVFKSKDKGKKAQQRLHRVVNAFSDEHVTEEWRKLFIGIVDEGGPAAELVIPLLGRAKDKRAVQSLMRVVQGEEGSIVGAAIRALGELGDPAALDVILEALKKKSDAYGWWVRNAVLELADASTVDKVRTIYAGLKDPNHYSNWHVRSLLQSLEARFPGR